MSEPSDATRGSNEPSHPDPSSYGIDPKTGVFIHPRASPYTTGPRPVRGSLDAYEDREYIRNMTVEGRWPLVPRAGVTFQQIMDFGGRRIMYHYYRTKLNVYDITDAKNLKVLLEKEYTDGNWFGAATIAFNKRLGKWIMLQSFEVPRSVGGMAGQKYTSAAAASQNMGVPGLRGFRVFELASPTEWRTIAEVSTDAYHPRATVQEGSGALDAPTYFGGKYACIAAAPDNTFIRMEFPNYNYSPAQMIYDVENPADPRLVAAWWVPGQRLGEEDAYAKWRACGDRTSWTGARMPIFLPQPLEDGGRYGYAVMGQLGFHVLDLADPANPRVAGSLELPYSVAGVQGDGADVSRVIERGIVLCHGFPMNEDGYEPYKDIYVIDVRNPARPEIVATLPRPKPPAEAPYSDFVLRRGKFGPKRPGYYFQPGKADPNVAVYSFNTAGVQIFDIRDPRDAKIVAYFVPKMTDNLEDTRSYTNPMECIMIEWDRKLIWGFANSGVYLLSSPALGKPNFGPP